MSGPNTAMATYMFYVSPLFSKWAPGAALKKLLLFHVDNGDGKGGRNGVC